MDADYQKAIYEGYIGVMHSTITDILLDAQSGRVSLPLSSIQKLKSIQADLDMMDNVCMACQNSVGQPPEKFMELCQEWAGLNAEGLTAFMQKHHITDRKELMDNIMVSIQSPVFAEHAVLLQQIGFYLPEDRRLGPYPYDRVQPETSATKPCYDVVQPETPPAGNKLDAVFSRVSKQHPGLN